MIRRARWIVLLVVVLLVAVALLGALLVRPDLVDARDRVDARWTALRPALVERYDALEGVENALDAAGASDRAVTRDLHRELGRWSALSGRSHPDVALEAKSANSLEALERRAYENFRRSDRLRANPDLLAAFTAFDEQVVSEPARRRYNRAITAYEGTRDGAFERIVAAVLGFESRPKLLLAPG